MTTMRLLVCAILGMGASACADVGEDALGERAAALTAEVEADDDIAELAAAAQAGDWDLDELPADQAARIRSFNQTPTLDGLDLGAVAYQCSCSGSIGSWTQTSSPVDRDADLYCRSGRAACSETIGGVTYTTYVGHGAPPALE